jgi:GTP-binding protein LepA
VVIVVRVLDGVLRTKSKIRLMAAKQDFEVDGLGVFSPKAIPVDELGVGEVGFVVANIKVVADAKIGDTLTETARQTTEPFPGFKELKPMVFAGLYPVESHEYAELREALEKLRLNDASFFYEPESSTALGFGFRCGFLGLLHMEIVQERLEREYNMDLVTTAPGVLYRVTTTDGEVHEIDSPAKLPDAGRIAKLEEPVITAMILTPVRVRRADPAAVPGQARRAEEARVPEVRPRPDHLRAAVQRSGHGLLRQAEDDVARLCVARLPRHRLLGVAARQDGHPGQRRAGGCAVRSSCTATRPTSAAVPWRRRCASSFRDRCSRSRFRRRSATASSRARASRRCGRTSWRKCYGGDISRKRKLLEKQKEGKKRMKRVGRVEIPQEAFLAVLKVGTE